MSQSNLIYLSNFEKVKDFQQQVLKLKTPNTLFLLNRESFKENLDCLVEEIRELENAHEASDFIGVVDALADLIYFAYGIAVKMGLPFDAIFDIVHKANMQKVLGQTKRGHKVDAKKPEGWEDPKHAIARLLYGNKT